ncbi:hypothetical protein HYFRA_00001889 [Hymenoscyphus fraxineus]|uniref:Uncharacterized protein n=1 Tax=Hymenoscyphus fraxineus TaxID=746836 RepID=A0A9N9KMM9_9HELO|nr:hypothetical protein HYFRA_00001889 [Hymenoscyphus fraxineus]
MYPVVAKARRSAEPEPYRNPFRWLTNKFKSKDDIITPKPKLKPSGIWRFAEVFNLKMASSMSDYKASGNDPYF